MDPKKLNTNPLAGNLGATQPVSPVMPQAPVNPVVSETPVAPIAEEPVVSNPLVSEEPTASEPVEPVMPVATSIPSAAEPTLTGVVDTPMVTETPVVGVVDTPSVTHVMGAADTQTAVVDETPVVEPSVTEPIVPGGPVVGVPTKKV